MDRDNSSRSFDATNSSHVHFPSQSMLEGIATLSLKYFFYGLHNLRIPKEMALVLNPDELAAKFIGAGELKERNRHRHSEYDREFFSLIRLLDEISYPILNGVILNLQSTFPFKSGVAEQKSRLESVSGRARLIFIDSFFAPYTPPNHNDSKDSKSFHIHEISETLTKAYENK